MRRGRYGTIWEGFWPWAKAKDLSDAGKCAACFLVSTKHGDSSGAVELPALYLAHEQGWDMGKAEHALAEVVHAGFALRVGDWFMVRDYPEHYPATNPKHAAGIAARVKGLPRSIRGLCAARWLDIDDARQALEKHGAQFISAFKYFAAEESPLAKPSESPLKGLSIASPEPIETLSIPDSDSVSDSGSGSESESESDLPSGDHCAAPSAPAVDAKPRARRERPVAPGLARLMDLQRQLGGDAIEKDPATAIAFNRLKDRGEEALEAAVRRAWREDSGLTSIRSLRWLLQNLDRWLAPAGPQTLPGMPNAPPRQPRTRFEREREVFRRAIEKAEAEERAKEAPIEATEVRRTAT